MPKEQDDFDEEVARLGSSQKFIDFLNERSREQKSIPVREMAERLGIDPDEVGRDPS